MEMNRRVFLKASAATGAIVILPVAGCVNVRSLLSVAVSEAQKILTIVEPSIAATLGPAITALEAAIANWTTGTVTSQVIEAVDAVAAILDAIPVTASYSLVIDAAVAAFDAVLALFGSSTPATVTASGIVAHAATAKSHIHRGNTEYTATLNAIEKESKSKFGSGARAAADRFNTDARACGLNIKV